MTDERAFEINSLIVGAYMIRERIVDEPAPDLSAISLNEAIEATLIVKNAPPQRSDKGTVLTCFVEPTRVPFLYSWALDRFLKEAGQ